MRFEVLGALRVLDAGGRDLGTGAPQQRAVLAALLADAGRTVSTTALVDAVWGEDAGDAAATSLQVVVSRLRKRLGPDGPALLVTACPGYRLQVGPDDVDARRFGALVARARERFAQDALVPARADVEEALALWRGEPYADVRPGVVDDEVTRLVSLRLTAVELAAELDLALGRHAAVAARLPAEVAENPLREGLRGSLVLALYRCGEQARALEVYEQGREVLAEELGIDPSPQLQRLHALVLRQDPALDPPLDGPTTVAARPASPAAAPSDALVGRTGELEACAAAWRTAQSGRPTAVAVVGEAGIGKTRLVEEVGARAAADGAELVWGRCLDGAGSAAFAPWRQVVQALAASRGPEAVARATSGRGAGALVLLPGSGAAPAQAAAPVSPEVARTHLFEGVTAFLEVVAAETALLVVLEDLHWADPETVQLTEHVVTHAARAPLCVLLTVRDPEPGAAEATDRVLELVSRLPTGERVQLSGLSPDDVRRYAASRLDASVDASVAQRLHDRTNGNPFFIAELVRLLREERAVAGRADVEVPRSVHAVLERRLAHLGSDLRAVLSAAAVLGRDVDVRLLAGVLGRSPLELLEPLDAASTAGVLRSGGAAGQQQFTHALVQEVLLAATGPMRRAALHARAADVLEAQHAGDLTRVAARLAHHHVAAGAVGDPERAVRACLLAATSAEADAAYAEAERLLRTALDLVPATSGSQSLELELEVRVRLLGLLTVVHGYSAAGVLHEQRRAQQLVALVGTTEQRYSTLRGAMWSAIFSGDLVAAEELADEVGRVADRWQDDALRQAHHCAKGLVFVQAGRTSAARPELERACALAADLGAGRRGAGDTPVELLDHPFVTAHGWLALLLGLVGEDDAAQARAEQARAAARSLGHAYSAVYLAVLEGWRHVFAGRPSDAERVADEGLATARAQGFQQLEVLCLAPHGWGLAISAGSSDGAALEAGTAEIRTALAALEALPGGAATGNLWFVLSEVLGAAGRWEEALRAARGPWPCWPPAGRSCSCPRCTSRRRAACGTWARPRTPSPRSSWPARRRSAPAPWRSCGARQPNGKGSAPPSGHDDARPLPRHPRAALRPRAGTGGRTRRAGRCRRPAATTRGGCTRPGAAELRRPWST